MADIAGLILAVAGAFGKAIACFEYVQLARTFDRDYQTATLKLDVARLRLSRWGKSVGIDRTNPILPRSLNELNQARDLLEQFAKLFEEAETQSTRLQDGQTHDRLDDVTSSLHRRLLKLSLQTSNLANKAKWALFTERQLNRLIEDITDLINGLFELFPAAQPELKRLCAEEGSELAVDDHVSLLVPIIAEQDPELSTTLQSRRKSQTINVTFAGSYNYGLQQGYFSGSQTNHFGSRS